MTKTILVVNGRIQGQVYELESVQTAMERSKLLGLGEQNYLQVQDEGNQKSKIRFLSLGINCFAQITSSGSEVDF